MKDTATVFPHPLNSPELPRGLGPETHATEGKICSQSSMQKAPLFSHEIMGTELQCFIVSLTYRLRHFRSIMGMHFPDSLLAFGFFQATGCLLQCSSLVICLSMSSFFPRLQLWLQHSCVLGIHRKHGF